MRKKRPDVLRGFTQRSKCACSPNKRNLYTTVNYDDDKPFELSSVLGKAGGCQHCLLKALSHSLSLNLQHGEPVEDLIKDFAGYTCKEASTASPSCLHQIMKAIENGGKEETKQEKEVAK